MRDAALAAGLIEVAAQDPLEQLLAVDVRFRADAMRPAGGDRDAQPAIDRQNVPESNLDRHAVESVPRRVERRSPAGGVPRASTG
jgi:hypothetical protein